MVFSVLLILHSAWTLFLHLLTLPHYLSVNVKEAGVLLPTTTLQPCSTRYSGCRVPLEQALYMEDDVHCIPASCLVSCVRVCMELHFRAVYG